MYPFSRQFMAWASKYNIFQKNKFNDKVKW